MSFEAVFCFIYTSVSFLAGQVSTVAAKYGSMVVYISKVRNGKCVLLSPSFYSVVQFPSRNDLMRQLEIIGENV